MTTINREKAVTLLNKGKALTRWTLPDGTVVKTTVAKDFIQEQVYGEPHPEWAISDTMVDEFVAPTPDIFPSFTLGQLLAGELFV